MDNSMTYKISTQDEYRDYKKVVCVFYSYSTDTEKLNLLLLKKPNKISELISTEISKMDNAGTIAIARYMTANLFGLFSKKNLEKMRNNNRIELNDLICKESNSFKEVIPWIKLFDLEFFVEWIQKVEGNLIQYDLLEETLIYFIEIPFINTDLLSDSLSEIDYPYTFEYFEYDYEAIAINNHDQQELFRNKIDFESLKLMKSFNFDNHIKNSTFTDIYLIITCQNFPTSLFKGSFLLNCLYAGLYRRNNEQWLFYSAYNNEFPSDEILKSKNCKAIIIPGSSSHVYDHEASTDETIGFIRKFMTTPEYNHVKFLGVCYGHQIFNEAMNGKVVKAKEKTHYVEKVECSKIRDLKYINNKGEEILLLDSETFNVYNIHADEVASHSEYMINYGGSQSCENEVLISVDKRVLTLQGHPEYNSEFIIFRFNKSISWINNEEEIKKFIKSKKLVNGDDTLKSRVLFYNFLKNKII